MWLSLVTSSLLQGNYLCIYSLYFNYFVLLMDVCTFLCEYISCVYGCQRNPEEDISSPETEVEGRQLWDTQNECWELNSHSIEGQQVFSTETSIPYHYYITDSWHLSYIYTTSLLCFPFLGHLGWFHNFTVVNIAAVNSYQISL